MLQSHCSVNENLVMRNVKLYASQLTFVESSNILVCSAINLTQKQLRWTSMGQLECENDGCLKTGLLMPDGTAVSAAVDNDNSSDSECGTAKGPWIWQLPPNGPVPDRLCNWKLLLPFATFLIDECSCRYWVNVLFYRKQINQKREKRIKYYSIL